MTSLSQEPDAPVSYTARRVNQLARALGLRRYLEIGVETGLTFLQVDMPEKTGVDPEFQFDWQQHDGQSGVQLHPRTSDAFFAELPADTVYDLIFVDGLHTFEQTYRDILHALRHSHPGTILLIDDTIPCDVFSTCRDQQQCYELRAVLGDRNNNQWHGDTYKVVPLLNAFNCDMQLVTMVDGGNPQTLLWRPLTPLQEDPLRTLQAMGGVQNLAAADYIWFLQNLALFNPVSEQQALETVIQSRTGA